MPNVVDYEEDDKDKGGSPDFSGGGSGRPSGGSGPSTPAPQGASPQHESTFVPWDRFTNANQEVSTREAGKLQSSVQGDVTAAEKGRDDASKQQKDAIDSNYQASGWDDPYNRWSGTDTPPKPTEGEPRELTASALNAPAGAKNLEDQLGADPWAKLLGQTANAGNEAHALGSETGVQGLIQDRASQPLAQNGAFDAALESQAGGQGFRDIDKKYGDNQLLGSLVGADEAAQSRWSSLTGDVAERKAKEAEARAAQAEAMGVKPTSETPPADTPTSIDEVLFKDGAAGAQFWSDFHQAGLSLSPADWALIGLGEGGIDTPLATEAYVTVATSALSAVMKDAWPASKVKWAFNMVDDQYNQDAMQALAQAFKKDPAMLQSYLKMNNPGFMARHMRAWLESQGFKPHSTSVGTNIDLHHTSRNDESHVRSTGATGEGFTDSKGQQRQTSDEQETARIRAYREGWGGSWDKQFEDGVDEPAKG